MMKKSLAAVSYDHKNRLQFSDTSLSVLAYFYLREIIHLLLKYHSISHQDIRYKLLLFQNKLKYYEDEMFGCFELIGS